MTRKNPYKLSFEIVFVVVDDQQDLMVSGTFGTLSDVSRAESSDDR